MSNLGMSQVSHMSATFEPGRLSFCEFVEKGTLDGWFHSDLPISSWHMIHIMKGNRRANNVHTARNRFWDESVGMLFLTLKF